MTQYGTVYQILDSHTTVTAEARLVDLKTDKVLWTGKASASTAEQQNQNQGGLAGMLITAIVKQIVGTVTDQSHPMAGLASQRLLSAGSFHGLLYGPRSPRYMPEAATQP
jgi:hypothetical protein